jgi:hypothetical protein
VTLDSMASEEQLTTLGQILSVCAVVGAVVIMGWLLRGAVITLTFVAWLLYASLILTPRAFCWVEDAHARGLARLEHAGLRQSR